MDTLTEEQANRVYDILRDVCGAYDEDQYTRFSFVHAQMGRGDGRVCHEWRFQGKLGFGGKFWNMSRRWYVNAYQEDQDDSKRTIIEEANRRLAALRQEYENVP